MELLKWVFLISSICMFFSTPTLSDSSLTEGLTQIPLNFLNFAKRNDLVDYMIRIRRKIHENPELGYEEFETSQLIRTELDKMGISYKHPFAVTGVVGFIGSGDPPFVALRADMDALAMQVGQIFVNFDMCGLNLLCYVVAKCFCACHCAILLLKTFLIVILFWR